MYVWIWRRLPGNVPVKLLGCLLLLAGAMALMFFFLFPWVEHRLPFNDVTINQGPSQGASPTPSP
jgi:hypothetical protein